MESTKDQFRMMTSAFRVMEGGTKGSPAFHLSACIFRKYLNRLPEGAHEALMGKRQALRVSKHAYDRAETIIQKADHCVEKRYDSHTAAAIGAVVCKNVFNSAIARMSRGENRQNKKPEDYFYRY